MDIRRQMQQAGAIAARNYELEQEYLEQLNREVEEYNRNNVESQAQQSSQSTTSTSSKQTESGPSTPQENSGYIPGGFAALNPNYGQEHGWKARKETSKQQKKQSKSERPDNYIFNSIARLFGKFASVSDPGNADVLESAYTSDNKKKNYFSDAFTKFVTNKNQTQIESSEGKFSTLDQFRNYLNPTSIEDYIHTAQEYIGVGDRLNNLIDRYLTTGISREESLEMDNLRTRFDELESKKNHYEQMFDMAKQYESMNSVTGMISDAQSALADVDLDFGTGIGNSLRGFNKAITNLQKALATRQKDFRLYQRDLQAVYNRFNQRGKVMQEKWREDLRQDREDLKRYEGYEVSDYFNHMEEISNDMSLFNPVRWMYQGPGLIGSSMSSPQKQIGSMVTGLAAGLLTGGGSWATSLGSKALILGTYGLNLSAGSDENFANVAQATKDILQADLKAKGQEKEFLEDGRKQLKDPDATVDDIYLAYVMGEYVPKNYKIRNTIMDAASGSLKQFMKGQGVNTLDATFDTAIEVLPVGKLSKAAKLTPLPQSAYELKDAAKNIVTIPFKNTKGGRKIVAATQAVGNYANKVAQKGVRKLAEQTLKHTSNVTDYSKWLGGRILNIKQDAKALGRGAWSFAKRTALSSYSEAVEEGLQQEQQYERMAERDDSYYNAADQFLDTVVSGPRLWWQYLTYDPKTATEEEKVIYQNMQGGILGAWLQGGVMNSAQSITGTAKEIRLDHAVMNNILAEKIGTDFDIEKGKRYSKYVRKGQSADIQRKLDEYRAGNERLTAMYEMEGDPIGLPSELIDNEETLLQNIKRLNLNPFVQITAKKAGFKSEDYDTYISLLASHQNRSEQDRTELETVQKDIDREVSELYAKNQQSQPTDAEPISQSLIHTSNYLKALFGVKAWAETVEKLTGKKKDLLSRRAQRLIDQYNQETGMDFKSEEEIDAAAAKQGIPIDNTLVQHMQNLGMLELQSEISSNMASKMMMDADTAKKETEHYKKVKKSDEDLRQFLEDAYIDGITHEYDVQEAIVDDSNNVYIDRDGKTVVAMKNPTSGKIEKVLYDNGELVPGERPMPFDKHEWYDYQSKANQDASDNQRDKEEFDEYLRLRQKDNLTESESKKLEKYNEKFTDDYIRNMFKRIDDADRMEDLQNSAPLFDNVAEPKQIGYEPVDNGHVQVPVREYTWEGPFEFERRQQEKERLQAQAKDLANQREREKRVIEFNRKRPGNSKLTLRVAADIEEMLQNGYVVQKSGKTYTIQYGNKKEKISKAAYDYANTYFVPNKPVDLFDQDTDGRDDASDNRTEKQKETLNRIVPFKVKDGGPVKYELRTGMDYFVQDPDGIIRRRSRVHSVLPNMFTPKYGDEIIRELITLREQGDTEGLKAAIKKYEKHYNDLIDSMYQDEDMRNIYHIDMTGYIEYCDLINDVEGFDHVLRIFDNIQKDKNGNEYVFLPKASVISGTILDDIQRQLFEGVDVQYDPAFRMSEDTFNKFKQNVLKKKKEFEDQGYIIITDRYCWYTDEIAGETDMLLIDKDGNIHIVDFKTSSVGPFTPNSKVQFTNEDGSEYIPAIDTKYKSAAFTSRKEYTDQLSMYALMIQAVSGIPVTDIRLLGYYTKLDLSEDGRSLNQIKSIADPQEIPLVKVDGVLTTYVTESQRKADEKIVNEKKQDIKQWFDDAEPIYARLDQIYQETDNADIKNRIEKAQRMLISRRNDFSMLRPYYALKAQDIYNKLIELSNYCNQIISDYEAFKTQQADKTKKDVKVPQKPQIKHASQSGPGTIQEINKYNRIFIAPNKRNSPAVKKLEQLSANPDFLINATFYVNLKASKDKSYISLSKIVYKDSNGVEHVWEGNDVRGIQIKLADIDQNGNPYLSTGLHNPIAQRISWIIRNNEGNLDNIEVILTGLSRTNGVFVKNDKQQSIDKALNYTSEQKEDLFDGKSGDQICIVGRDNAAHAITERSRVGNNKVVFNNLSALSDPKKKLVPGQIVIIHDLGYMEDSQSDRHLVPVYLEPKKISSEDADLIISCLQNKPNVHPKINGVESPLTNRQIIEMLVRFGSGAENTDSTFIFRYAYKDENLQDASTVDPNNFDFDRVYLKINDTEYMFNIKNDVDVKTLKDILTSKVNLYANNFKLMGSKLSLNNLTEVTNPFTAINQYFAANPNINELRLSDDLVFTRDDMGHFGYHWMMDHGWVTTDYAGVTNPIISTTGVEIKDNPDIKPPQPDNNDNPVTPEGEPSDGAINISSLLSDQAAIFGQYDDYGNILPGLGHRQDPSKKITPIQKAKAQKTFRRIVGDSIPVEWLPTLMDIANDPDVVGMCKASAIFMSETAENGTDFHESFHATLELLMNKQDRQKIYNYYRKVYGDRSEREIAEDLADKFFAYSRYIFHPNNAIGKIFAKMWSWIRAMYTTRDATLSKLFVSVDWGKYADGKITNERKEEFKRRFGDGLRMKVSTNDGNTISLKHFFTSTQLDDAINTLLYQIVKAEGLNSLGSNAQNLNFNEDYIKNLKKDENGKFISKFGRMYAVLTLPGVTEDQLQQFVDEGKMTNLAMRNTLMFRELFDNYKFTQERLFAKLQSMGIITTEEKLDADRQNIDAGEGNTVANDIQGHSDEFYTHSRSEDVTSQVKFFLSTRPALRYATQEDVANGTVKSMYKLDKDGKPLVDRNGNKIRATVPMKVNSLGMIQFLDFKAVHQRLLTALSGVKDVQDLYDKLVQLGQNEYLFANIASSLYSMRWQSYIRYTKSGKYDNIPIVLYKGKRLSPEAYIADIENPTHEELYPKVVRAAIDIKGQDGKVLFKKGDIIQGATIAINADMEALTTQLFQGIKSQHLNFNFTYVRPYTDDNGNIVPGKYKYEYKQTSADQSQQQFPIAWFDNVRSSYSGLFMSGKEARLNIRFQGFKRAKSLLETLYSQINRSQIKIDGTTYDITKAEDADSIYTMFVETMNEIGININKQSLIYILQDMDLTATDLWPAFTTLLTVGDGSMSGGAISLIAQDGIINRMQEALDNNNVRFFLEDMPNIHGKNSNSGAYLYANSGFIQLLASQYGKYRQRNVELMTLGAENTKQYTFAQNHTGSDITDDLNHSYDENGNLVKGSILDDMSKVAYVISADHSYGSVIAKQLLDPNFNPQHNKIEVLTSSGVKLQGDRQGGTKYIHSTAREDYLSKTQMLVEGNIIAPTLSDKSTYVCIRGFKLPGFDWSTDQIGMIPYINKKTGTIAFSTKDTINNYVPNAVLDQFIEYFKCELDNVRKTINDLGLYGEKNTATPISEHDKIKNYHTGNINGARFFSLMGVYDENDNYISFNVYDDSKQDKGVIEGYNRALEYFFNKPVEQQRNMVAKILQHRLEDELQFLVDNGVITEIERPATDPHGFFKYENKYFDQDKIDRLYRKYVAMNMDKTYGASACRSMAVVAMVFDTMCKSIMSIEEMRRFYTGMPQFFKTRFTDGKLTEYGVDETKRYGGFGSTGENNRNDLPNINEEYTCAEIKDWEIGSSIAETLGESFKECEYREAYAQYLLSQETVDEETQESRNYTDEEAQREAYSTDIDVIEKALEDAGLKSILDKKIKAESDSYRSKINVADGTAYISDKMAENLLRMRGAYSREVQQAFERLRGDRGYLHSVKDYKIIFDALLGTQKYSAFGYRMQNGLPVHFYNKFALFPIFKGIAYGFTRNLYNKMVEGGVDMVMFDSAVKSGSQDAQRFNPELTRDEVEAFTFNGHTYKQKYSFIRRQLNTDPRTEEEMAAGTQAMKIALSTLRSGQTYTIEVEEDGKLVQKEVSGDEYVNTMMKEMIDLAELGAKEIHEQFYTNGVFDLAKFTKFAVKELSSRNADKNILEALQCTYDVDANGNVIPDSIKFPVDINCVSNLTWLETIINSVINKKIIDIKFKGNAYYQRSIFGVDSPMAVINDKDMPIELNGGRPLQMINEEGSMDAVISIDYFKDIIPPKIFYDFNKAKQWLIDNDIISGVKTGTNEWHNATAQTMGYRIPTQALASISALRFVDVIPVVRDTIMLPKEFTKVTGSDFDIDKLILSTLYYERTKDGVKTVGLSDVRKNTANNLLRQYLRLIKDRRYNHLKYRSIDNDTELIKDVLSEIHEAVTKEIEPYQFEQLSNQVNTMQQFATGKVGIGPFALNNNNHILTTLYHVAFSSNRKSILTYFGKDRLDRIVDDKGNSILSWLSAFINSHVDIAKDPYITSLNINKATYNLTALLIRTGFGENALYFLNNPIIRELAQIELQQSGNIVDDPQISKTTRVREATKEYIHNTFNDSGLDAYFKQRSKDKAESQRRSFDLIKAIFDQGVLKDMVTNKSARIDPNKPVSMSNMSKEKMYDINGTMYSPFELQAQLFLAKEAFDVYGSALNLLVQATKIDTKKQGNTVQQQNEYMENYIKLLDDWRFDNISIRRLLHNSFIDTKTKYGTSVLKEILQQVSISATDSFLDSIDTICSYIGNNYIDTKTRVSNALMAYIKQICMNRALEKQGFTSEDWRSMIVGNRTLAQRIEGLKRHLLTDKSGKYSELVSNGMIINPLLDNLRRVPYITQFGTEHYDLITLDNTSDDSQDNSNNYIDAWQQLLDFTVTDDNGNLTKECLAIRKLASDLAIYAFMTSADTRGFTKFFKYVPISWRKSIGYSDEMARVFQMFKNGNVYLTSDGKVEESGFTIDVDEFFLNFAYDNIILPTTNKYIRGFDGTLRNRFGGTSKNFDVLTQNGEIVQSSEYALMFPTGITYSRNDDTGRYPLYIKLQRNGTNRNSPDRFLLYRCVGTYMRGDKEQPIYGLVTPKGVSIRVGAQTYQFYGIGRNDTYKHIYDRPDSRRMSSRQYEIWIDNIMRELHNSNTSSYTLAALAKYPQWAKFITGKFQNPTGVSAEQLTTVASNRSNVGNYMTVNSMAKIATSYYKNEPQNHPQYVYLFTENAQAYMYSTGMKIDGVEFPYATPKLNVSAAGGTNQAAIRTDSQGNISKNAFGIVVKKYQQDETGNFVAEEGQFRDTDEDFELFVRLNEDAINNAINLYRRDDMDSIILPGQFALGKAALPRRFAEKLAEMLYDHFGVKYKVEENKNPNYSGYGLSLDTQLSESPYESFDIQNSATRDEISESPSASQLPQNYVLHSGGANGADTVWGQIGEEFGIPNTPDRQMHYYNEQKTPKGNVQISREDYEEGRHKVAQAAKANWGYEYNTMKDDRLIRNWAQVKYSDAIFAIGHIAKKGEPVFPNKPNDERRALHSVVQGGTGYAVEMAIQTGKPVYVYDQERKKWFKNIDGKWLKSDIPTLTPNFAGIGTRNINQDGIQAIRDVYQKTLSSEGNNAQNNPIQNTATRDEIEEAKQIKEHCKRKGDKS